MQAMSWMCMSTTPFSQARELLSSFDQLSIIQCTSTSDVRFPKFTHAGPLSQSQRLCRFASVVMPGMTISNTALPLTSCIGFNGSVDGGLVLEKDGTTVIYPLGSTIIVRQLLNDQQQTFLQGHTDEVGISSTRGSFRPFKQMGHLFRSHALSCHLPGGIWHRAS